MALDAVADTAGLNVSGPFDQTGNPHAALPSTAFFAPEWSVATVRPKQQFVAVVCAVNDNRVVGDTQVVELLENRADVLVVLNHPGANDVFLRAAFIYRHLDIF